MPVVERLTFEDAQSRRQEILVAVGGSEDAFRQRAEAYALDARELALFDELQALYFLLGG